MTDLITKLETAESGSRELSDEVLLALGWRKFDKFGFNWINDGDKDFPADKRPSPTESVDDALGLVPEGWRFGIEQAGQFDEDQRTIGYVWLFSSAYDPDWQCGQEGYRGAAAHTTGCARTPALALCAATLRAQNKE